MRAPTVEKFTFFAALDVMAHAPISYYFFRLYGIFLDECFSYRNLTKFKGLKSKKFTWLHYFLVN